MRLTKRSVDATKPNPRTDVFNCDDSVPGFGLRVKPSGAKSFIIQRIKSRRAQGTGNAAAKVRVFRRATQRFTPSVWRSSILLSLGGNPEAEYGAT